MALFLGLTASTAASAWGGQDFTCPQSVAVTETARGVPKDWRIVHDIGKNQLFEVSMVHADDTDTMNDYEKKLPGGRIEYTWDLNAVVKRQPWFVRCEYRQTHILLLIPVPEKMKFCSTTQKNAPNRDVDSVMHCR